MKDRPSWSRLTVFESLFRAQGLVVAGTDEVGRGPLAGPVVAAAVVLDLERPIEGLDDSKRLTELKRLQLYQVIQDQALAIGLGGCGPRTIERVNIYEASRLAMRRAIRNLGVAPDVVLTDAMPLAGAPYHSIPIIRGDGRSASIAAASIVAKVARDFYMARLHQYYPYYGFDQHKGYATRAHREAIQQWGPSRAHRQTFLHEG